MEFDIGNKTTQAVDSVSIKVLGGTFTLVELVLGTDQTAEDAVQTIRDVPAERWFVIVAENEVENRDTLALIDDDLEFHIHAMGRFQKEA